MPPRRRRSRRRLLHAAAGILTAARCRWLISPGATPATLATIAAFIATFSSPGITFPCCPGSQTGSYRAGWLPRQASRLYNEGHENATTVASHGNSRRQPGFQRQNTADSDAAAPGRPDNFRRFLQAAVITPPTAVISAFSPSCRRLPRRQASWSRLRRRLSVSATLLIATPLEAAITLFWLLIIFH